jgi:hypothetical protein
VDACFGAVALSGRLATVCESMPPESGVESAREKSETPDKMLAEDKAGDEVETEVGMLSIS